MDTYITYLPFLLPYNNSFRAEFLKNAEEKAIETGNKPLIECVEKALSGDELVNFYFQIAQISSDDEYYNKILKLNNGHAPSLYALFMRMYIPSSVNSAIYDFHKNPYPPQTVPYLVN